MSDGKGCKCAAYDESECACDADWTPQELIDARAEIERLREEITRLRLTDAEREAVQCAIAAEHERGAWQWAETLRSLLERTK
jgi:endonuclease I